VSVQAGDAKLYGYPSSEKVFNALRLLLLASSFLAGVLLLATGRPPSTPDRVGLTVLTLALGLTCGFLAQKQLRLLSTLRLTDEGIQVYRSGMEALMIRWTEIRAVQTTGRSGDFEVLTDDTKLRVRRRLLGLAELRAAIDHRWSDVHASVAGEPPR
jgi:hypothetical protein